MIWKWVACLALGLMPAGGFTPVPTPANWRPITSEELKMAAADTGDPEAEAAVLFREGELIDDTVEGTILRIYVRLKIFNDRGRRFGEVQLPYRAEIGKIGDVRARTVRSDGSAIDVQDRDVFDTLIVNGVQGAKRAVVFSMPGVEPGSIIEYRYRQTYIKGFRYFAIDLQTELFTRELHFSFQPQASSNLALRWVTFNAPDPSVFATVWDGNFDVRAKDIPPLKREPLMPPDLAVKIWGWLYYSEEFDTDPEKYWRSYARRMHERAERETEPTRAIKRVVSSISLAGDSTSDRVRRIYDYVQSEIANIGPRGASLTPEGEKLWKRNETAEETIRHRYGTPREINRLFIAMLRAAGLDARVAELTTRDENFFHRKFPDAFQLNSEVTAILDRNGAPRFFDPGTPYCPIGMLSWEKEGVPALVYGKRDSRFIETPVSHATANIDSREIKVEPTPDGGAEAVFESKNTGQRAIQLRNELIGLPIEERRQRMFAAVRDLKPLASLREDSLSITNLNDPGSPLTVRVALGLSDAVTRTESRMIVRPALISRPGSTLLPAPRRANSLYFHYPYSEVDRVSVTVPDGYEVEHLPDPVVLDIGAAKYRASFTQTGTQVVYERLLVLDAIMFTVDEYPVVKQFFDRVSQADNQVISMRKGIPSNQDPSSTGPSQGTRDRLSRSQHRLSCTGSCKGLGEP
jgi:transglutaminase-like putative cysteine protease